MEGNTYFRKWGFSINECAFPNIHMSWRNGRFNFYLGICRFLGRRIRVYFGFPLPFTMRSMH